MKVLHINCNYLTTALHQTMLRHMGRAGVSSTVLATTYDRSRAVIQPDENVIAAECFNRLDRLCFHYKQSKIIRYIDKTVAVPEFDCIHAHTVFTDGNAAMRLSEKYGLPYIVAVRDTDVNTFFKYMVHLRPLGRRIILGASAVVFLSAAYRSFVLERYFPPEQREELLKKCRVIPNGIDEFWLRHSPDGQVPEAGFPTRQDLRLIYAGRVSRRKNITTTQRAIRLLTEKGYSVRFTVVGKIDQQGEYRKVIRDKYTVYEPPKCKEELAEMYRRRHIFVMPSFTETFGLVYAEAISQGLPVVYTRGQGFDGQFEDGVVGYAADADSPAQVAEAIERIVGNYASLRSSCLRKAGRFNWDDIAAEYLRLYGETIGTR